MSKSISLYLIAILSFALEVFCSEGVIDGRDYRAKYQIMFEKIKVNNLSSGESVGIGDGFEMSVLSMLRRLRENIFYSHYRDLIRERKDRTLQDIPKDYRGPRTVVELAQHALDHVSVDICSDLEQKGRLQNARDVVEHFKRLLKDFMKEDPHPVGLIDDFEQFYYIPYLSALTSDVVERYNKQIIFSVELMRTLEIFHGELLEQIMTNKNPEAIQIALDRTGLRSMPIDAECKHIVTRGQRYFLVEYLVETVEQTKRLVEAAIERAQFQEERRRQNELEEARSSSMQEQMLRGDTASLRPAHVHSVSSSSNIMNALQLATKLPQDSVSRRSVESEESGKRIQNADGRVGRYYPSERRAFLEYPDGSQRTWYNDTQEIYNGGAPWFTMKDYRNRYAEIAQLNIDRPVRRTTIFNGREVPLAGASSTATLIGVPVV